MYLFIFWSVRNYALLDGRNLTMRCLRRKKCAHGHLMHHFKSWESEHSSTDELLFGHWVMSGEQPPISVDIKIEIRLICHRN